MTTAHRHPRFTAATIEYVDTASGTAFVPISDPDLQHAGFTHFMQKAPSRSTLAAAAKCGPDTLEDIKAALERRPRLVSSQTHGMGDMPLAGSTILALDCFENETVELCVARVHVPPGPKPLVAVALQ
jgi:hypothetical protein